jgi:hypothetical protein
MSVLVRVGVDICIQLSPVSSCLAGQVNNNNNMLSNELEGEKKKITTDARTKMEDDLKKKIFSLFLLNLGANLSWGLLSSLRFLLFSCCQVTP